jgi:hypothetical protein
VFDSSEAIYSINNLNFPCGGAVTLEEDRDGNLWVGATCGLLRYDPVNDVFEKVLENDINTRVNQLQLVRENHLVCVTSNTIFYLEIQDETIRILRILDEDNGVQLQEPSENGIAYTQDRYVWLPSSDGIQRMDLDRFGSWEGEPTMVIHKIGEREIIVEPEDKDCIKVSQTSLIVDASVVDHKGRDWKYRYKVRDGAFSPWQDAEELLIVGLRHGTNDLLLQARWLGSPEKLVEKQQCLEAFVPFWSRKSTVRIFGYSLALLLLLIIALIIRNRLISRRMLKLKSRLLSNRLQTIHAYFNPHFLFNTLTTLQDQILHHDRQEGSQMVVKLSRIFRKVLDMGQTKHLKDEVDIPLMNLKEEISLIKDIVYLQNKQTDPPVELIIEIDEKVKQIDPLIPPMLIQPFIENIFKHAFDHTSKNKKALLKITLEKETLIIAIADNGLGISLDSINLKSKGMRLAKERMQIMNELNIQNNIIVEPVEPHGTRITIYLKLIQ